MTILHRRTQQSPDDDAPPDRWTVYERHVAAIRAYAARRVERDAVDDVVAETFAIAWRGLPREADPLPWLYGVARRVVHGHRRSHSRRTALLARVAGRLGTGDAAPDPADQVVGDPALARAFATLTETEREAIRLVAWEGLDHDRAARAAGCSVATFAVRLSRARTRLRVELDGATEQDSADAAPAARRAAGAPATAPAAHGPAGPIPAARRAAASPSMTTLEIRHAD